MAAAPPAPRRLTGRAGPDWAVSAPDSESDAFTNPAARRGPAVLPAQAGVSESSTRKLSESGSKLVLTAQARPPSPAIHPSLLFDGFRKIRHSLTTH